MSRVARKQMKRIIEIMKTADIQKKEKQKKLCIHTYCYNFVWAVSGIERARARATFSRFGFRLAQFLCIGLTKEKRERRHLESARSSDNGVVRRGDGSDADHNFRTLLPGSKTRASRGEYGCGRRRCKHCVCDRVVLYTLRSALKKPPEILSEPPFLRLCELYYQLRLSFY